MPWLKEGYLWDQLPWICDQHPWPQKQHGLESNLCTLGLWQGFDLIALALIFQPRTILASPLTLSHLNPLVLVTRLAKPFRDFRRWKRGLGGRRLLRGGQGKSRGGGSAVGTSRMSAGQKMFSTYLHLEAAGTLARLNTFAHTSLHQSLQTFASSSARWIFVSCT